MSPNGTPFANTATPNIAGFYMGMVKCERKVGNIVKWCHQLYNCLRKDCTNISTFLASGLCLDFMNVGLIRMVLGLAIMGMSSIKQWFGKNNLYT